ncbi:hypothetical protein BJ085DRAFT_29949 [Dimargaris cristalligena]|uniref:Uncharacterized protein n=1 Tax=Dimargaris cristalligena TaxID=215637 RepID=A0A4P9ZY75_9FUNG|nr:hypothetical protein BJ085DRAFT_29949 [Dimargaris cristalligena]|eukprot:RKP38695.1 hypothetical protein BJ085DRAFT_29949 [Dimargaris cristalligena]
MPLQGQNNLGPQTLPPQASGAQYNQLVDISNAYKGQQNYGHTVSNQGYYSNFRPPQAPPQASGAQYNQRVDYNGAYQVQQQNPQNPPSQGHNNFGPQYFPSQMPSVPANQIPPKTAHQAQQQNIQIPPNQGHNTLGPQYFPSQMPSVPANQIPPKTAYHVQQQNPQNPPNQGNNSPKPQPLPHQAPSVPANQMPSKNAYQGQQNNGQITSDQVYLPRPQEPNVPTVGSTTATSAATGPSQLKITPASDSGYSINYDPNQLPKGICEIIMNLDQYLPATTADPTQTSRKNPWWNTGLTKWKGIQYTLSDLKPWDPSDDKIRERARAIMAAFVNGEDHPNLTRASIVLSWDQYKYVKFLQDPQARRIRLQTPAAEELFGIKKGDQAGAVTLLKLRYNNPVDEKMYELFRYCNSGLEPWK